MMRRPKTSPQSAVKLPLAPVWEFHRPFLVRSKPRGYVPVRAADMQYEAKRGGLGHDVSAH